MQTDILIVGSGAAGLYCALSLPRDKNVLIITKDKLENSDSFLAQGGICVLRDENDYESFFEDTMRAGHYENNPQSVDVMIRSSRAVIGELVELGVRFERDGDGFAYTKEGAHSKPRILFHEDETGKEITSKLLTAVQALPNVRMIENCVMVDLLCENESCLGVVAKSEGGQFFSIQADYTVLATGGIGGLFEHSTNYSHLTGDALAVAIKHGVKLKNIDYIQIHPTTFYEQGNGRKFLISESVRGEGAVLLNWKGERFVDELLPRDVVANAILQEMQKDGKPYVWLSMAAISADEIKTHFPHIYQYCLKAGYDVTKQPIPVVPAQHYFMGGIDVDENSGTSMQRLFAVGETACNGVHGKNRLASNSLLESLVFAKRAAAAIVNGYEIQPKKDEIQIDEKVYEGYEQRYKNVVLTAIEKEKNK